MIGIPPVRLVNAIRYVTPLREGGSMPAIVEADDEGTYVLKFRGAGHGAKALIAEWLGAGIARALGLPIPEIVLMQLDPEFGKTERDPEIRTLIQSSAGLNLAVDYLPGAIGFEVMDRPRIAPDLASLIVWFDSFITNVDRAARNPNMLWWKRQLYLIDHGAAFYFQHNWPEANNVAHSPFRTIKDHVLLLSASQIEAAGQRAAAHLNNAFLDDLAGSIPTEWLEPAEGFASADAHRAAYGRFMRARLESAATFVAEARRARTHGI
ncbi:MAG: aminotransferase class I and II [Chloroflexi bacterium]|nr:aminotransferase class I and II [Chloroflexota bacterium]